MEVLNTTWQAPNDVGQCVVAALLNCLSGAVPTTILDVPKIQTIWSAYMTTGGGTVGYYSPSANVKWDHSQIVAYFGTTMPY